MKRSSSLIRRTALQRKTPLRAHSPRRLRQQANRRALTAAFLEQHPACCLCGHKATELHEPQKRSRNPKAWLDEDLVVPSCRHCNRWAEEEPELARQAGWLIPSWVPRHEAVERVRDLIARPLWSRP